MGPLCLWQYMYLTPSRIVPVLVSLCMIQTKYPPSPKSLTAAPDMRHVQSLLLPPAQVFICIYIYIKPFRGKAAISCQFQYVWQAVAVDAPIQDLIGLSPCTWCAAIFFDISMKYSQFLFNILETYLTGLLPCTKYIVSISPSSRMQQTWVSLHDGDDAAVEKWDWLE